MNILRTTYDPEPTVLSFPFHSILETIRCPEYSPLHSRHGPPLPPLRPTILADIIQLSVNNMFHVLQSILSRVQCTLFISVCPPSSLQCFPLYHSLFLVISQVQRFHYHPSTMSTVCSTLNHVLFASLLFQTSSPPTSSCRSLSLGFSSARPANLCPLHNLPQLAVRVLLPQRLLLSAATSVLLSPAPPGIDLPF